MAMALKFVLLKMNKSFTAQRFIRTMENRICKYMTVLRMYVLVENLDNMFLECSKKYNR